MTFEEYLATKKIDGNAFATAQPAAWGDWQREFAELHPNSFTAQKLYLINRIRRQFPLTPESSPVTPPSSSVEGSVRSKPIMRPKTN